MQGLKLCNSGEFKYAVAIMNVIFHCLCWISKPCVVLLSWWEEETNGVSSASLLMNKCGVNAAVILNNGGLNLGC
ncbi:hypothetical protein DITRI_Ditri04bG0153800 [Diplodiscus trichospermus]